jgi:hypothetical protein
LRIVALRVTPEFVCSVVGGAGAEKAMEIGGPAMLSVTVTLLVGSAVETAVRLTGAEEALNWVGTAVGVVYIVTAPLDV